MELKVHGCTDKGILSKYRSWFNTSVRNRNFIYDILTKKFPLEVQKHRTVKAFWRDGLTEDILEEVKQTWDNMTSKDPEIDISDFPAKYPNNTENLNVKVASFDQYLALLDADCSMLTIYDISNLAEPIFYCESQYLSLQFWPNGNQLFVILMKNTGKADVTFCEIPSGTCVSCDVQPYDDAFVKGNQCFFRRGTELRISTLGPNKVIQDGKSIDISEMVQDVDFPSVLTIDIYYDEDSKRDDMIQIYVLNTLENAGIHGMHVGLVDLVENPVKLSHTWLYLDQYEEPDYICDSVTGNHILLHSEQQILYYSTLHREQRKGVGLIRLPEIPDRPIVRCAFYSNLLAYALESGEILIMQHTGYPRIHAWARKLSAWKKIKLYHEWNSILGLEFMHDGNALILIVVTNTYLYSVKFH